MNIFWTNCSIPFRIMWNSNLKKSFFSGTCLLPLNPLSILISFSPFLLLSRTFLSPGTKRPPNQKVCPEQRMTLAVKSKLIGAQIRKWRSWLIFNAPVVKWKRETWAQKISSEVIIQFSWSMKIYFVRYERVVWDSLQLTVTGSEKEEHKSNHKRMYSLPRRWEEWEQTNSEQFWLALGS